MSSSKPLYGKYPGKNRYHTDQVPWETSLASTKSYNDKGEGSCWMRGTKVDLTKRQCTLQPCFRAVGRQNVKPVIIFALKPKIIDAENGVIDVTKPADSRIFKEMAKYDRRVQVYYDPKSYACGDVCVQTLRDFNKQTRRQGKRLLGLDNWGAQATDEYQSLAKSMNTKLAYSPSDCTDLCAVTDYGLGKTLKEFMVADFQEDFDRRTDYWSGTADGAKTISASERRILFTKWLGNAWTKMRARQNQITTAFKACGMYNSIDGSENHLIKLPRYQGEYTVDPMETDENEKQN